MFPPGHTSNLRSDDELGRNPDQSTSGQQPRRNPAQQSNVSGTGHQEATGTHELQAYDYAHPEISQAPQVEHTHIDRSKPQNMQPGSGSGNSLGMSIPFPPQARISDLHTMFNRNTDPMHATLPIMQDVESERNIYGYTSASPYAGPSASSAPPTGATYPGLSGFGDDTWQFQFPIHPQSSSANAFGFNQENENRFLPAYLGETPTDLSRLNPGDQSTYVQPNVGGLPTTPIPQHSPYLTMNPWQTNASPPENKDQIINSPPLQNIGSPTRSPFHSISGLTTVSALDLQRQPSTSRHTMQSMSSESADVDSLEDASLDEMPLSTLESQLTAEDMADEDELAELREIERGGSSRRAERRRMRNKLAQRAFRARAKVSKKDVATRLVEAESSNTSQNQELSLLRVMVDTLQRENTQLKRQMQEKDERPDRKRRSSSGTAGPEANEELVGKGKGKERKRSREDG